MKNIIKNAVLWMPILCLTFTAISCSDADLAEAAEGQWVNTCQLKDDEGIPYTQSTLYTFNHIDDGEKDGGTFVEKVRIEQMEEEDGMSLNYSLLSSVNGEWEIVFGDLYLTYDPSTLEVTVDNFDFNLTADATTEMRIGMAGINMYESLTGEDLLDTEELKKEIQDNYYLAQRQRCVETNEADNCLSDFQVEGNSMSFGTADVGRIEFHRLK